MYKKFFKRYWPIILFLLVFSVVGVSLLTKAQTPEEKLPVYSPSMVSPELVEEDIQYVKKYHKINPFSMTNQNGLTVTEMDYSDKIYVADFFFTTCPNICPIMTANMIYIQEKLKEDDIMLASFSVTPEIDTVEVLKKYSLDKGVNDEKWNLMTGDRVQIYDLARKSFLVVKEDPRGGKNEMIHTENFVLVDKEKRIRGYYDGTKFEEMEKLLVDIEILKKSYEKI
tara:strand:- start:2048 stop:2725 length:678 start_codon:yes stop_codon:yes gene_type:complete